MNVSDYIFQLQTLEEYSFSWDEILKVSTKSEVSLKRELSRLVEKNKILNLRKEFYLILPPRYARLGQIPIQLYANKLFKYLNKKYYLGFYSAAKFYGASHQQLQQEYVMTDYPKIGDIDRDQIKINFITSSKWPENNIVEKKSDAGIFKISSPSLTAVNLIHYQNKIGGLNRMLAVIEELLEEITIDDMFKLLQWYSHKSTLQRFGYLLGELGGEKEKFSLISDHLKLNRYYPVLLVPKSNQKAAKVDNIWKVDVNTKLENDL